MLRESNTGLFGYAFEGFNRDVFNRMCNRDFSFFSRVFELVMVSNTRNFKPTVTF